MTPSNGDTTLTATPHIVAVVAGGLSGFLSTKIGLPADYVSLISVGVTTVMTSFVHWLLAKLSQ
jgi:hypothetical protein